MARAPAALAAAMLVTATAVGCWQAPTLADAQRRAAAMRGVRWLLEERRSMPAEEWVAVMVRIYRVIPDEPLAASLATAVRHALATQPLRCDREDLDGPHVEEFGALYRVLADLLRCRHERRDYRGSAAALARSLGAANPVWTSPARHQLVLAYLLERVAIPAGPSLASIRAGIGDRCEPATLPEPGRSPCDPYAVTHVVLTASDYFQRRLDPAGFPREVRFLRDAMRQSRGIPADDRSADLLAEVLISYQLLQLPFDPEALALRRQLVAHQNRDGSWGAPALRRHLTAVVTLALLDFVPTLRGEFGVL